jgi:hypothetical protein
MKTTNLKIALTLLMLALNLVIVSDLFSQPVPAWVRSFNNSASNDDDVTQKSVVDAAGNVYIIAYSKGTTTGYDFLTLKYNSAGDLLWSKRYNNDNYNGTDDPNDITVDNSGNVYVIGTSSRELTKSDAVLIKYNPNGTQLWVKRSNFFNHNFGDNCSGTSVAVSPNGSSVYIAYDMKIFNFQGQNYIGSYIIKYSSAGDSLGYNGALTTENSVANLSITDLALDANENLYSSYNYDNDIWLVKYSPSLINSLWTAVYDGDSSEYGVEMKMAPDGHCVVLCRSFKINQGYDYVTLKFGRDNGQLLWEKRFNNPQASLADQPNSLTIDESNNVIVTGSSMSTNNDNDILTIKYNASGGVVWEKRYNGSGNGNDQGRSVITDNAGNVYVAGFYYRNGQGGHDFMTLKYSASGVLDWAADYALTSMNDQPASIGIDNNGNLYITGRILRFLNTDEDVAVIKYASTVGIQQISGEIPSWYELQQNYPNPFNPITNIKFSIPKAGSVKLVVFDISGREVAKLVNEQLSAGIYNFDLNTSHLSSGVYFYKLFTNEFTEVKKMILVK